MVFILRDLECFWFDFLEDFCIFYICGSVNIFNDLDLKLEQFFIDVSTYYFLCSDFNVCNEKVVIIDEESSLLEVNSLLRSTRSSNGSL